MRPKKKVLCVDSNAQELSILCFTLKVTGFNPIPATNLQEAVACFVRWPIDIGLVSCRLTGADGAAVVEQLKRINRSVPMLLMAESKEDTERLNWADAVILKRRCSTAELLERIKIMSARKRGPKDNSHHMHLPGDEALSLPGPSAGVPAA